MNLLGEHQNIILKIQDISARFIANIEDVFVDLLEIASYVYCADQVVTRGGKTDPNMGANWRRNLRFQIPVRRPDVWASPEVSQSLVSTLDFLSDDHHYSFSFKKLEKPPPFEQYFEGIGDPTLEPESIVLFSGGLDSLAGAIQEAVIEKKQVILVSHRSAQKIHSKQLNLVEALARYCSGPRPIHVPVWATKHGDFGRETTQRSRSFLYAALGATVAHLFDIPAIRMYENGIVSLNLPISGQLIGARATRTTHPRVIKGFNKLFSLIMDKPFQVENPFLWETKAEVVARIAVAGCLDLIKDSVSCSHVMGMTTHHTHCGKCSQCIGRRFAMLASGNAAYEPQEIYKVDLLTGAREALEDKTMLESYARTAIQVANMTETEFFSHFGEGSRVFSYLEGTSNEIATKILDLHKRHAGQVCGVIEEAIKNHAREILEERLPPSCLLIMALPEEYRRSAELPVSEMDKARNVFRQEGDFWRIIYSGENIALIKDAKGLRYIAHLLRLPEQKIDVMELFAEFEKIPAVEQGEIYRGMGQEQLADEGLRNFPLAGNEQIIDHRAMAEYKQKFLELEEDIREAENLNQVDRAEALKAEKEFLIKQIGAASGLRGRIRSIPGRKEKIRKSVTNRINDSLKKIQERHPALGHHLRISIKKGSSCSYFPEKPTHWEV